MHRINIFFVLILFLAGSLQAQTTGLPASDSERRAEAVNMQEANLDNYLLAPFDQVSVTVFDEPDLASSQRITAKGEISVPLIGTVKIGGLSVEEAKEKLEMQYVEQKFLRNPEVFVAIEDFSPKRITILGQVNSPNSFDLPMGANYLEIEAAIAMAGGFTGLARKSTIRVTRKSGPDGKEKTKKVDMDDLLSNEDSTTSRFRIYPGDIIFVPRRYF